MKVQLTTINANGLATREKVKIFGRWVKANRVHCVMVQEMTRGGGVIAQNIESGHWGSGKWIREGLVGLWIDGHWGRVVRSGGWDGRLVWAVCWIEGVGEF